MWRDLRPGRPSPSRLASAAPHASGEGCSGGLRFSMAMLKGVALGLAAGLKDRLLYLLLLLSALSLFVCFQLGLRSLSPWLVNVGDPGDQAYVTDFHQRESNEWSSFRWTKDRSFVRLPDVGYIPVTVSLTLNGWRPEDQAAPQVVLLANGRELSRFPAEKEMATYQFRYVPALTLLHKDLVLEIRSDTFSPASDEARRELGVLLDTVRVTPVSEPLTSSYLVLVVALAGATGMAYLILRSVGAKAWCGLGSSLVLLGLVCVAIVLSPLRTPALAFWALGLCATCYASTAAIHSTGSSVRHFLRIHPWLLPVGVFLAIQAILVASVDVVDYDEAIFLDIARSIVRTGVPVRSIGPTGIIYFGDTPLYVFFLSLASQLCGGSVLVLRLLTDILGLGSVVLVFLIGRKASGPLAGTVAAALLAVNPFFATYSFFIRMEVPMVFFLLLGTYLISSLVPGRHIAYLLAAGCSVGIAVLVKEVALAFWAACTVYVFIAHRDWSRRLSATASVASPTIIGLALWTCWGMRLNPEQFRANLNRWSGAVLGGTVVGSRETMGLLEWLWRLADGMIGWGGVLLFAAAVVLYFLHKKTRPRVTALLLLYMLIATGASLIIRLKEPRHLIALIPTTALVIGIAIDWRGLWVRMRQHHLLAIAASLAAILLVWGISPLRLPPPGDWANPESWRDPLFSYRVFESDRYYGALRDVGRYLATSSPPDTVITVVHEAPVVAYYADRHYWLLYTLTFEGAMQVLGDTEFLVVDQVAFPYLSDAEIQQVLQYVEKHFEVVHVVEDAYRQVPIYRRRPPEPADFTGIIGDHERPLSPDEDRYLNRRPLLAPQGAPLACRARRPTVELGPQHLVSSARVSL
jgi:4-amino-4-deoxy-L-arabinose transferase-like glycosyltransferase